MNEIILFSTNPVLKGGISTQSQVDLAVDIKGHSAPARE